MDKNPVELGAINFREVFPCLHLFRAFRIAIDIRKIMLAGLALVALSFGESVFSTLPFAPSEASSQTAVWQRWPPIGNWCCVRSGR
jgi:hypothetical protein